MRRRRLPARLVVAAGVLLLCAACQVDVELGVDGREDGTGTLRVEVALDPVAVAAAPDFHEQLRVQDLTDAGWRISTETDRQGGGQSVVATYDFRSPEDAERALGQLSGADGPFRDFDLEIDRTFARTESSFRGTVDLQAGVEGFSDEQLKERLGGSALGFDPAELEKASGQALGQIFRFEVAARLPGDVESNAPTTTSNGAVWRPTLGEEVVLEASSSKLNTRNVMAASVAAVAGVLFVVVVTVQSRLALRRRRRRTRPADDGSSA